MGGLNGGYFVASRGYFVAAQFWGVSMELVEVLRVRAYLLELFSQCWHTEPGPLGQITVLELRIFWRLILPEYCE